MPTRDISYNWSGRNDLESRIAALADDNGPFLARDAFKDGLFIRTLRQDKTPDVILTALFTELGVVETDPAKVPLDSYLFLRYKDYLEQLGELSEQEIDELKFVGSGLVRATSSYTRAFREFRETVEDFRGRFFDIPLGRAEAFGGFVIEQVLSGNDEVHSTGSD